MGTFQNMGLLISGGKLKFRNGKPLIDNDLSCCCSPCCCVGSLPCCSATETFNTVDFGTNCASDDRVIIDWQWQSVVGSDDCIFTWNITMPGLTNSNFSASVQYANGPACSSPAGNWTAGSGTTHGEFDYGPAQPLPANTCDLSSATVTITKTSTGYLFTVAGVITHTGGLPDCDCTQMNGSYWVEC